MIGIIIGCIVLIIVGWSIIKGKAPLVLMGSGVIMLACSIIFDTALSCPKKVWCRQAMNS